MAQVIVVRRGPLVVFQRGPSGAAKILAGNDTANAARFAGNSASSATLSQAWAEGTEPGGPGTKSAKEEAEVLSQWSAVMEVYGGGYVIPGVSITFDMLEVDNATKRIIGGRELGTGRHYEIGEDGSLVPSLLRSEVASLLVADGSIVLPGVSDVVAVVADKITGRAISYTDSAGLTYDWSEEGWAKRANMADALARSAASGSVVQGMPVPPAASINERSTGRALLPVDGSGRPWVPSPFDQMRPLTDGLLDFDIVIYGSSLGGLMALSRAARRGKRVAIIEPYSNFGGMHANGLIFVDTPSPSVGPVANIYGGLTYSEYFAAVADMDSGVTVPGGFGDNRFVGQAKTYERVAQNLIAQYAAWAIRDEPIERPRGVLMGTDDYGRPVIQGIWTRQGLVTGRKFIDASYEGDLMAAALGPSGYVYGRESSATYGESTAGYREPGINFGMGSGFLHGPTTPIGYPFNKPEAVPSRVVGSGDDLVMSYSFRLPLTRQAELRMPFAKPYGYNPDDYRTYLQFLRTQNAGAGYTLFCRDASGESWGWQGPASNNKVAWNFGQLINGNVGYPDGNWTKRRQITEEHVRWQQGLFWTVQSEGALMAEYGLSALHADAQGIGLCADEFEGSEWGHGWPYWLYARETRRLKAMTVLTQANTIDSGAGNSSTESIGKWSYYPDIHVVQAFIPSGFTDRVAFEGQGSSDTPTPVYQIPLSAMIPEAPGGVPRCTNLIVPVCAGFSHVAWAPQRLEIPFGYCGEAAGELAAWLCDNPDKTAQQYDYSVIASRLTALGSKL